MATTITEPASRAGKPAYCQRDNLAAHDIEVDAFEHAVLPVRLADGLQLENGKVAHDVFFRNEMREVAACAISDTACVSSQ